MLCGAYGNCNTDSDLNAKNIMCCAGKFWIFTHITVQIKMINFCKIFLELQTHTIKCNLVNKGVICDQTNDTITLSKTICCPTKELYVGIRESIFIRGFRCLSVAFLNALINHIITA